MHGFSHLGHAVLWTAGRGDSASVATAIRLVLAGIFATAGFYKMRRPKGAAYAAVAFGVIRRPSASFGRVLGGVEFAAAVFLIAPWQPLFVSGAILASVLAVCFTFVLGRAISVGERFQCNCLSDSSEPFSVVTLCRAVAMAAGAIWLGGAWRNLSYPAPPRLAALLALALALAGIPLLLQLGVRVWSAHLRYVAGLDWFWVREVLRQAEVVPGSGGTVQ